MRRFLGTLLLACVLVVAIAYALGWFSITTQREPGQFTASIEIYTGKITTATHNMEDKARQAGESAKERVENRAGTETVKGSVKAIDENSRQFTLTTTDGHDIVIQLVDSSTVASPHLNGLQVGERVSAAITKEDGKNIARTVTVESGT